jgi:hypothetical protein
MTARHDVNRRHAHALGAMTVIQPRTPPATTTLLCAGKAHLERGLPAMLDVRARSGPSRVGLIEDGAMFCASCAQELNRGGEQR